MQPWTLTLDFQGKILKKKEALRSPSKRPRKESSLNTLIHTKKQKIIRKLKLQIVSKKYIETKEVHCHHWQQLLRTEEVFISPTIQNRKSTNMADNGNNGPAPSSPALEIVTKEALSSCLLECFASLTFANKKKRTSYLYLKITGLKNSETEAIHTLLQLAKEKLEVPLQREDFTIRLIRPGTSKIPSIHAVQLHSLWKESKSTKLAWN